VAVHSAKPAEQFEKGGAGKQRLAIAAANAQMMGLLRLPAEFIQLILPDEKVTRRGCVTHRE